MEDLVQIYSERLGSSWFTILEPFIMSNQFHDLRRFIDSRLQETAVYPDALHAFDAFQLCPFEKTKVVIIGQDPYHDGSANGLAFSTNGKLTPSLRVIIDSITKDIGLKYWRPYDFSDLATQGVLLLNSALTVEHGKPGSHAHQWRPFTETVIAALKTKENLVWMVWGNHANQVVGSVPEGHLLLSTVHPAATLYNRELVFEPKFNQCNHYLKSRNLPQIMWAVEDTDLPF